MPEIEYIINFLLNKRDIIRSSGSSLVYMTDRNKKAAMLNQFRNDRLIGILRPAVVRNCGEIASRVKK